MTSQVAAVAQEHERTPLLGQVPSQAGRFRCAPLYSEKGVPAWRDVSCRVQNKRHIRSV